MIHFKMFVILSGWLAADFFSPFLSLSCKQKEHTLEQFLKWKPERTTPVMIAHRLAPFMNEPENAVSTMKACAVRYPCALQEMDVRMSSDGELLMMHDSTLERTTTGEGVLSALPYSYLKTLHLKNGFGEVLNEAIPTLDEMLKTAGDSIILMLDVKPGTNIDKVMQRVHAYNLKQRVVVILYSLKDAVSFEKNYKGIMMAIGFNSWEHIAAIEQSGLPFNYLLALTPQKLQPKAFYDKIHSMGIMASASVFGNIDRSPSDSIQAIYQNVFATGGDIICSDSLHNVMDAFK